MTSTTSTRLAPLTGVGAVVLLVASLLVEGTPPDADAATEEVVRFYADNVTRLLASSFIAGLGGAFLIWFGGSVFAALRRAESGVGRVSAIAFAGILLVALGHVLSFGLVLGAAETVGGVPAEVTQTMASLAALLFLPFAVGMLVATLASAVVILRHGVLPHWLGYFSLLAAVVVVIAAPFGVAISIPAWFLAAVGWVLVLSVVLFLRSGPSERASASG